MIDGGFLSFFVCEIGLLILSVTIHGILYTLDFCLSYLEIPEMRGQVVGPLP